MKNKYLMVCAKIIIKNVKKNDCSDLYEWRNDPETRKMFFVSRVITWDEHKKWFEDSLTNPNKLLLLCYNVNKEKIGVVRFDIKDSICLISVNLNPSKRGQGLSSKCIKESINFFILKFPLCEKIVAIVKENNVKSINSFISSDFILLEKKNKKIFLEYSKNLAKKKI